MVQLTCIFFHMNTGNTNAFFCTVKIYIDITMLANRFIELGDLIVFRKVRVKIVFTVKFIIRFYFAVKCQACTNGKFYNLFIQNRQCTGHTQAHRANVGIRLTAKLRGAGAKSFRFSFQFCVNFKTNNSNVFSHHALPPSGANTL